MLSKKKVFRYSIALASNDPDFRRVIDLMTEIGMVAKLAENGIRIRAKYKEKEQLQKAVVWALDYVKDPAAIWSEVINSYTPAYWEKTEVRWLLSSKFFMYFGFQLQFLYIKELPRNKWGAFI
jgi:hypothetical protein